MSLESARSAHNHLIYGLDFSSNPSKRKKIVLAHCELTVASSTLQVSRLEPLNTDIEGDYSKVSAWLNDENYGEEWTGGIDFPFGLPVIAIERLGWARGHQHPTWSNYIEAIYASHEGEDGLPSIDLFCETVDSWKKRSRGGEDKRVFALRYTDFVGGFAGSAPSSPLKVHHQCNPPVGRMFFRGAKLLHDSAVSVHPVRITESKRTVIESYPRLVADKFINGGKYKDAPGLEASRREILSGLADNNCYGFTVSMPEQVRRECVDDHDGDSLDSVLSAVQAAWCYTQQLKSLSEMASEHPAQQRFGIPQFHSPSLRMAIELEGWIPDPLLLEAFAS